jgi:hypothetical protein
MGLAPYGEPKFKKLILDKLIDLKADGSFRLDVSYFDYCTGLTMTNERFSTLFGTNSISHGYRGLDPGGPGRGSAPPHSQPREKTGGKNLCLAGLVALNCVAASQLARPDRSNPALTPYPSGLSSKLFKSSGTPLLDADSPSEHACDPLSPSNQRERQVTKDVTV